MNSYIPIVQIHISQDLSQLFLGDRLAGVMSAFISIEDMLCLRHYVFITTFFSTHLSVFKKNIFLT